MILLLAALIVAGCILFGFRSGLIVLDRNVFGFQIDPIIKSGTIANINQYRIVHSYLEMKFEENPDSFESSETITKLNSMMAAFHENNP